MVKRCQACSDEELVVLAKKEADALYVLITRYERWIRWKAVGMSGVVDADDLVQEGFLGLLSAVAGFDSGRDVRFSTYAAACVTNRMRSALRKNQCNPLPVGGAEAPLFTTADDAALPDDVLVQKEMLSHFWETVVSCLSAQEYEVCMMHLGGMSYHGIAKKLSLTTKAVDSTLQRVRRKLRQALSFS